MNRQERRRAAQINANNGADRLATSLRQYQDGNLVAAESELRQILLRQPDQPDGSASKFRKVSSALY
jgi:hypothetical protein